MAAGGSAPGEATASAEGSSSGAARTPVERSPPGEVAGALPERSPAGDVGGAPPRALAGQLRGGDVEPLDLEAREARMQRINASNARNRVQIAMDAWSKILPPGNVSEAVLDARARLGRAPTALDARARRGASAMSAVARAGDVTAASQGNAALHKPFARVRPAVSGGGAMLLLRGVLSLLQRENTRHHFTQRKNCPHWIQHWKVKMHPPHNKVIPLPYCHIPPVNFKYKNSSP